jgi:hypothetical protein
MLKSTPDSAPSDVAWRVISNRFVGEAHGAGGQTQNTSDQIKQGTFSGAVRSD